MPLEDGGDFCCADAARRGNPVTGTRGTHTRGVRYRATCIGLQALASLARRNDNGCGPAMSTFEGATFVGIGFPGMALIFLTPILAGGMI